MEYADKYRYFQSTDKISVLFGKMEDGTRIASAGMTQKLINIAKNLLPS